jgi:hypothetical protein
LAAAEQTCAQDGTLACHDAVLFLADAITYYLGAVAVAQYMQAVYGGRIKPDPTLNRSLRNLRRVLPGQWLGWISKSLAVTQDAPIPDLNRWYNHKQGGELALAYQTLHRVMVEQLAYMGDYGPQDIVSPRLLLELIDQYRIRRGKALNRIGRLPAQLEAEVAGALLAGERALLQGTDLFTDYLMYAPHARQLLMGQEPVTPVPPIVAPADAEASILLYPPGKAHDHDYTGRSDSYFGPAPLFPLDPLLIYARCAQCDRFRVAALQGVEDGAPFYLGLDPECRHTIRPAHHVP